VFPSCETTVARRPTVHEPERTHLALSREAVEPDANVRLGHSEGCGCLGGRDGVPAVHEQVIEELVCT
jgi:hypothetical protein